MREDIFENAMLDVKDVGQGTCQSFACQGCGNINYVKKTKPATAGRLRRGNFFSQFTKKFSLGNGPPDLVQEYLVTKEGGKMLGTLVALSIARMPNLETFIWDMPTGILRDIWISLSSLGDYQPSKLQKVFIRFHNNRKALEDSGLVRSSSTGNQQSLPASAPPQNVTQHAITSTSPMEAKLVYSNHHVENPNFSILPPLRSISAIAIDELANLDELSVLVRRSIDMLRELRVGMAPEMHTSGLPADRGAMRFILNGGTLALLFNGLREWWPKICLESSTELGQVPSTTEPPSLSNAHPPPVQAPHPEMVGTDSSSLARPTASSPMKPIPDLNTATIDPALTQPSQSNASQRDDPSRKHQLPESTEQNLVLRPNTAKEALASPSKETTDPADATPTKDTTSGLSGTAPSLKKFKLETIELERHFLNVYVLRRAIDWSCLNSLTLLQCLDTDALWSALRTQYAPATRPQSLILSIPTICLDKKKGPHPRLRRMKSSSHPPEQPQPIYRMNLKHIHTDTVSVALLTFLKETLAPNTLQSLFLQDHPDYASAVTISHLYKGPLRRHRGSLTKLLLDSSHGPPNGRTRSVSARKWMLNREILSYIVAPGKMPKLRELSISLEYKDWHFFLQQLPNVPGLRSLHIPFIADHVYGSNLSLRELAMGVVDVINLRQECELAYLGVGSKCFEVVETKVRKRTSRKKLGPGPPAVDGHIGSDDLSSEAPSLNDDTDPNEDEEEDNDDDADADDDDVHHHHHHNHHHHQHHAPAGTAAAVPAPAASEDEDLAAVDNDDEDDDDDDEQSSSDEDEGPATGKQPVKMKLREI
ncbi:MAG: hypothetical protein Q9217_000452, partial [Psora testacea]